MARRRILTRPLTREERLLQLKNINDSPNTAYLLDAAKNDRILAREIGSGSDIIRQRMMEDFPREMREEERFSPKELKAAGLTTLAELARVTGQKQI